MDNPPWVRVMVVNFNGGAHLRACIDSLARQTMADFEAIVVDNASTDGSAQRLVLPDERFRLVSAGANLGFAGGNNLAARGSRTPWLACLNPDAVAADDWLAELRRATLRHGDQAMFGSTQLTGDGTSIDGCGDVLSIYGIPWRGGCGAPITDLPADDGEAFAPCAAAALYRREVFEAAGGFDEAFFCYIEDVDLGLRLRLRGERCIQVRRAVVLHVGSALTGRRSPFTLYHSFKNRLWMIIKCAPGGCLVPALVLHTVAISYLLLRTRCDQGSMRAAVSGMVAGFRGYPGLWGARRVVQQNRKRTISEILAWLPWRPDELRRRRIMLEHSAVEPTPRLVDGSHAQPDLDG